MKKKLLFLQIMPSNKQNVSPENIRATCHSEKSERLALQILHLLSPVAPRKSLNSTKFCILCCLMHASMSLKRVLCSWEHQ